MIEPPERRWSTPGRMTSAGRFEPRLEGLPRDIAALAAVAQGLLIHEHLAAAYGVTLTADDRSTVHIREVERLLELITERDPHPLDVARPPAERVAGNCRHFTVLMVAMLRAQGRPARARCGFGAYFVADRFEDHWVCEYWDHSAARWKLVDAQIDAGQERFFAIDFDLTDVPRDRFVTAGEAWTRCRSGSADPDRFGLTVANEAGAWWIAGNLMRDAAALQNVELLPWDCWAAMPGPEDPIGDGLATLLDELATLTADPDSTIAALEGLCQDDRVRLPPVVHNALLQRDDPI